MNSISNWFLIVSVGFLVLMMQSCTSAKTHADNFPSQMDYPGYDLIDARHTDNLALNVKRTTKIAVVVRDLSVTAFTNLEFPRYDKKIVVFEGSDRCCVPNNGMVGATGLMVYRFHFIKTVEDTKIQLIARHKGLSMTADHFDSDLVTTLKLKIE